MSAEAELYDTIGVEYTTTRREDARLAQALRAALGDAASVVNVGAGAGAYEPCGLSVVAVEPASRMVAQRPRGSARVVRAHAESLPFADDSFDAAMAVLSDHHWQDRAGGLCEMRRVSRSRAVLFTWDQDYLRDFWLTRDYLPAFADLPGMPLRDVAAHLGATRVQPFAIPHDFRDGFFAAYWRRPAAYLDAKVRAGISVFHRLPDAHVQDALVHLAADLQSGRWHERNAALLDEREHDFGYRILVAEYPR